MSAAGPGRSVVRRYVHSVAPALARYAGLLRGPTLREPPQGAKAPRGAASHTQWASVGAP